MLTVMTIKHINNTTQFPLHSWKAHCFRHQINSQEFTA